MKRVLPFFITLLIALISVAAGRALSDAYIVQRGDTFLGIALKHGLTQEQLQAANPEIDPDMILPGTRMIIPPSDPAAYDDFLQTKFSEDLLIETVRCFSQGDIRSQCLAEIVNPGQRVVYNAELRLTVTDGSGWQSESKTAPALIQLLPGEKLPVLFSFPFPFLNDHQLTAHVDNLLTTAELTSGLRLSDAENYSDVQILPGGQSASVTIQLADVERFSSCQILAAAYNAAAEPIGLRALTLDEFTQDVNVMLYALADSISSVKIWVETY